MSVFFPQQSMGHQFVMTGLDSMDEGENNLSPQPKSFDKINSMSPNSFLNDWLSDPFTNDTVDNMLLLQAHNTTG